VSSPPNAYLAACLAYRNEASYLREWIEFHRLVGVERFFLYNHTSTDDHREALAPYLDDGLVTLEDWPDVPGPQTDMYNHCLEHRRNDARWIAFIDIDEFLFSPAGRPLPELLAEYEEWPGIVANWANFGTSGHRTRLPGQVVESYLWRSDDPAEPRNRYYKCVVDPRRVARCVDPHIFTFTEGGLVDERKQPLKELLTDRPLYSKIRLNHYYTRSEEECVQKYARGRGSDGVRMRGGEAPLEHLQEKLNDRRDDAILVYAAALRQALADVSWRAPFDAQPATGGAETVPDGDVRYYEQGQAALRCVETALESADRMLPRMAERSIESILDFPCGRGRNLRVLKPAFPDARFTAGDVDRDAVDFCAEAFGAVPLYSHEDPAQIDTEAAFDLIWCGSLFPHLAAERWPGFLRFFETRLRPWGVLAFATLGRHAVRQAIPRALQPDVADRLAADYTSEGFGFQGHGSRRDWGTAVASPGWVCRLLEERPGLRLLAYVEQGYNHHDFVAVTRMGPRAQVANLRAAQPDIGEHALVEATGYDEATLRPWL
jgi:hypothetical protein